MMVPEDKKAKLATHLQARRLVPPISGKKLTNAKALLKLARTLQCR